MKRNLIFVILLILLILPIASAISFEMKDSFDKEEVLTAKLSGDFINPPLKQNISLYRGHVVSAIDISIAKVNGDYYIYSPLSGKIPANYSLVIDGISYKKGSILINEPLVKNFTITENLVDFTIDNGFINAQNDFSIGLENLLDENLEITMTISTLFGEEGGITSYNEDTKNKITLEPGLEKIDFKIDLTAPTTKLIQFSSVNTSYSIPVILSREVYIESKVYSFKIEPPKLGVIMDLNSSKKDVIYIYNTGTGLLTNITLKLSDSLKPYVMISENNFGQIFTEDNAHLNITLLSSGTDGKVVEGTLFVETDQGLSDIMDISITSQKGYAAPKGESTPKLQTYEKCSSSGGKICIPEEEECTDIEVYAKDGLCCPGECKPISKVAWKIFGWGILVIIVLAGAWFFIKKYKRVKVPLDLLEIAKERAQL